MRKKRIFNSLFILGIMSVIYAFGMILMCVDTAAKESYFNKRAYHTTAQITKVQASKGEIPAYSWTRDFLDPDLAMVEYTYEGETYNERLLNCDKLMRVGDYIKICVSPEDPAHVRAEHNTATPGRIAWIIVLVTGGIACMAPRLSERAKARSEERQQACEEITIAEIMRR